MRISICRLRVIGRKSLLVGSPWSTSRPRGMSSPIQSSAVAAKPACKYGAQCYRRHNPVHTAEYSHPIPPQLGLDVTNLPTSAKKRPAPQDPAYDSSLPKAAKPEGRAAKPADRAAKQAAKLDEKEARERRKAIGDAIKEGMRLPAECVIHCSDMLVGQSSQGRL